jgi:hypothetical protein
MNLSPKLLDVAHKRLFTKPSTLKRDELGFYKFVRTIKDK